MTQFSTKGLETYATNKEAESSTGVWVADAGWNGRKFLVRRAGGSNHTYTTLLQKLSQPHLRQIQRNTLDPKIMHDIGLTAFCRTVLVDWKGVEDESGMEVPCNEANAKAFFEIFPDLYEEVSALASHYTTFAQNRLEEVQEELGN